MRIIEVRDSFIKIETDNKVAISSFLQINDTDKRYIAQVIQTNRTENGCFAFAKILFLYDGTFRQYDKSIPSKDSEIVEFTFDIMSKSIAYKTPIIAGKFIEASEDILVDKSCFDKKMLVSVDSTIANNRILSNLTKQFAQLGKVVVLDMLGIVEGQKYVAGVDFKLPLNTESLEFMYEDCLNDATSDSKSLIKEIFNDLSEYSKAVPFLPFDALKSIVDDMVDKQHVFKLLVLKNKLARFAQQGYFAATAKDSQNLEKILNENIVVIDLSKLDSVFQNRYLETIYSLLDTNTQVFVEASNMLNKKNIKLILDESKVPITFITHSKFKYINEIKSMFDNFIIEPTFISKNIFKIYSTFLNSMPKGTYLLVGEGTNYIPFVSTLEAIVNLPVVSAEVVEEMNSAKDIIESTEASSVEEDLIDNEDEMVLEPEVLSTDDDLEDLDVAEEIQEIDTEKVIEQKADDLINKISQEVSTSDEITSSVNLFEDEDDVVQDVSVVDELPQELDTIETLSPETELELSLDDSIEQSTDDIIIDTSEPVPEPESELSFNDESEFHTEVDEIQAIEVPEEISDLTEDEVVEIEEEFANNLPNDISSDALDDDEQIQVGADVSDIEQIDIVEQSDNENEIISDELGEFLDAQEYDEIHQEETSKEPEVITITDEDDLGDIIELDNSQLDESELGEDTILVDFEGEEAPLSEEDLDKQIVEDVDKVFTTMKEDSISDSDLDFIDELNNDALTDETEEVLLDDSFEELPEEFADESEDGFLEPLEEVNDVSLNNEETADDILETKNTKTPIIPVYEADIPNEDRVMSDPIEQGDLVVHAKYGNGTVEKMIKYGTKTLYSINFDNVGRRLLDPTLTEIKKA